MVTTTTARPKQRDEPVPSTATLDVRVLGPVEVATALSMRRYASELTAALNALDSTHGIEARRALAPDTGSRSPSQPPDLESLSQRRSLAARALRRIGQRTRRARTTGRARRLRGDVFHVVDQRDASLIGALPEGRTVQTVHDLLGIIEQPDSPAAGELRTNLERAGHLVAISEATRTEITNYLEVDPARVSVIANGLGEQFRPIPPARLGPLYDRLPAAHYRVLHVASNAQPRKNLAATIRVVHALRQQGLDAVLIRAGAPLPGEEVALAERLGVASFIANCGYVSEEHLIQLYNAADTLLFPSTYEGFGWPPLEAMACGLPVVSTPLPALQETPEAGAPAHDRPPVAMVAGPHDIEALTTHVASVLTDGGLAAALREAGFAHAARFSWERTALAYLEVYRQLVAA